MTVTRTERTFMLKISIWDCLYDIYQPKSFYNSMITMVNWESKNTMFSFMVLLIFFFNNKLALGKLNEVHIFSIIKEMKISINNLKSYIYHWHLSILGCFFQSDCLAGFYCNKDFDCEAGCVIGSTCPAGHYCDLSLGSPGTCTGI